MLGEILGPLVEGLGYVIVPLAFLLGTADVEFVLVHFALTVGVGVFLSWLVGRNAPLGI